ncbi:MAG: BamA/TamA family outer membrane protein [Candidatus Marinimicrobia bacterium]|nr:BamA/TamA family outer membrane protein [Candidatus Neomarinimicrobiota bacterium]
MNTITKLFMYSLLFLTGAFAQFGQNIVQYEDFDWSYIQSRHFDIYYDVDGRTHADFVAKEAELAYNHISTHLNWKLKHRVSIIIYNSHNDFQQTNVIGVYMREGIGGVTELYKNRVVIPFDGSNIEFKHVIHHELVHAFINDYIYGGSLKNMIQSSIRVGIPGWMNEGLAEYLASDWDAKSDMWVRDLAINGGDLPIIRMLNGYWAYRGGQSVWKFITSKWGNESIAEIFYQIKSKKSVEKGLSEALGVDFKELNKQWHAYLKREYWPDITKRENLPDIARQLTDHEKWGNTYNVAPAISPDGSRIAILSNKSGSMALYMLSASDGKVIRKIVQGERSAEIEELHLLKPGITWSPDSKQLAFSAKSGHSDALFILDATTYIFEKYRFTMEGIFRPSWSPKGDKIAFVGNDGSRGDLYLFDVETHEIENLTNDWYSEDHVSWAPEGDSIYFISDRGDDLSIGQIEIPYNYNVDQSDIYTLNLTSSVMSQLTSTLWNETYPTISGDGNYLAYISDESGVSNIMIMVDEVSTPITNVATGITQLSWNGDDTQLIFTGFHSSGYDIFTLANPKEKRDESISIPLAAWRESDDAHGLLRRSEAGGRNRINDDEYMNYVFSGVDDSDNVTDSTSVELEDHLTQDERGRYKPNTYRTRFTLDNAQAVYSIDSRFGSQGMAYFVFSDILGDHQIYMSSEMEVSLKNSDYYLQYRYLKKKVDWNFVFYHNAIKYNHSYSPSGETQNYSRYRILGTNLSAMRPFSRFMRFEGSLDLNYTEEALMLEEVSGYNLDITETVKSSFTTLIPGVKYVWDNTLWSQTYPIDGIRTYLRYRMSPKINKRSLVFHRLTADVRKYVPITNGISFATRIFAGTNWGGDTQNFRMGGVPWLFSKDADRVRSSDSLSIGELYFSEYLMPVRGSMISERIGENTLLFNIELRLPFLLYYFPTIRYFGQINGVLFVDAGVAWNNDDDGYPEFWNKKSWESGDTGWLMSYGFGPRFIFLGMPWQLDYAWKYNPHKGTISERKWYLSIGLDY